MLSTTCCIYSCLCMHARVDLKSSHMAMTEFQNMSSVQSKNHTIADLILNF
jgi:hypothetical protein